jgi:adenosylmethionine-8-amino-7-oxononanoate aminotransferase
VRFAVPLSVVCSDWVYEAFMAGNHAKAEAGLSESSKPMSAALGELQTEVELRKEKKWWEKAKDMLPSLPEVRRPVTEAIERLQGAVRHVIELMVVFLLQTMVIPLFFLWVLMQAMRSFAGWRHTPSSPD